DGHDLLAFERRDDHHLRPRKQRRVDFERRVLGRRADEDDVAGLDVRQKRVLLRFVEAMNFVDEDDGLRSTRLPFLARLLHQRADLLDAGAGGGEGDETRPSLVGDDARERGLAGTGRTPEDHGRDAVALDGGAEESSFAEQLIDTDDVFEGSWAQTFS